MLISRLLRVSIRQKDVCRLQTPDTVNDLLFVIFWPQELNKHMDPMGVYTVHIEQQRATHVLQYQNKADCIKIDIF